MYIKLSLKTRSFLFIANKQLSLVRNTSTIPWSTYPIFYDKLSRYEYDIYMNKRFIIYRGNKLKYINQIGNFPSVAFLFSDTTQADAKTRKQNGIRNVRWKDMELKEKITYSVSKYGIYALIGSGIAYTVSKLTMLGSSYILGLSFKRVGWWCYLAGFNSGLLTSGIVYLIIRGFYIVPENVRAKAFYLVKMNKEVSSIMDSSFLSPIKIGFMRAYRLQNAKIAIDSNSRLPVFRHSKISLVFQVYGGSGKGHQALVTCEAHRSWSGIIFDYIVVDIINKDVSTILVAGSREKFEKSGGLRDLVTLNRKYI